MCRADYENPEFVLPINKSVPRIVTLTAKNVKGIPIYKEVRDGNEKAVRVDEMSLAEFRSGKYLFLVQYLQWRQDCSNPLGIVVRKLPQKYTVDASMEILFAEYGIKKSFDKESKQQVCKKFPPKWTIPTEEYQWRDKIDGAFTVDPETTKDLDDALTLEQLPGSVCRIGVHIADVSYFVEAGTPLDKEALFRCTSYYPGHGYESVPMLPPELSENHCSLLPDKDRLSLSVFLDVTEKGELVGHPQIKRTIVRSCSRLTYSDAQKIIDGQENFPQHISNETARKIQSLSFLAQKRRALRLSAAAFDHWSNSDYDPEDSKAHEMVEEMMILANEQVAKFLSKQIPDIALLRTQLPPKDHRVSDWVHQYGQYIKYSLFLRGIYSEETLAKMSSDAVHSNAEEFKVQETIWSEIYHAVMSEDTSKLQFLICNESHHPQLAVANSQFRRILPKSQYVCEGDQPGENVVHFSMGIRCYVHFTSPIRRYVDIQVHRLVLDLISEGHATSKPSKDQVAKVCRRSTYAQDNARKFDKACSKVHTAAKLKGKSHETKAVIALIENQAITVEILNQEYNHLSARQRRIQFSHVNPFTADVDQDGQEIAFTWKLRLYIPQEGGVLEEAKYEKEKVNKLLSQGMDEKGEVLSLPAKNWQQILKAFQERNYEKLTAMIRKTNDQRLVGSDRERTCHNASSSERMKDEANMGHFYNKKLSLRTFDVINMQLTAHMTHGVLHPEVQLLKINPSIHICVEHRKYPRECFATTSRYQASRKRYSSIENYINAWKPVLAMEAATGAIDESDEFTIHNLKVQWTKKTSGELEGSFSLPKEYCTNRQIEFYAGDFVCVRVREEEYVTEAHSGPLVAGIERTASEVSTCILTKYQNYSLLHNSGRFPSLFFLCSIASGRTKCLRMNSK